ncbi:hypothetical protein A2671_02485 [Candidatus Kaiserbacteria bacterium RIFCSPHIGHO2_01_FULL_49_13]|uniref:Uncharacterized protein n=1 Tax=Candidatus Kaiserbacteria bacterium RIFCSPHIGHO2_01_FULL_49_13 TaxID=1798477 RepID=A0A1F6CDI4_9BACT|nr:MAG: hypothetical protein A2671_02485 [Candidatus Kaiserbacteria bacterium RIFCSPHIGHO2_01_FULL_49_13]
MSEASAKFYFGNLAADVARCISALELEHRDRFKDSLGRAYDTLEHLRGYPEAHEEGLLMIQGLIHAREQNNLKGFKEHLYNLVPPFPVA